MTARERVRELRAMVEAAVDDGIMGLRLHDAMAEVAERVCPEAFGWTPWDTAPGGREDRREARELVQDLCVDVMLGRGYVLADGELAARSLDCFEHGGGRGDDWYVYKPRVTPAFVIVRRGDRGPWLATEVDGLGEVAWAGEGRTPQGALDAMRMVI